MAGTDSGLAHGGLEARLDRDRLARGGSLGWLADWLGRAGLTDLDLAAGRLAQPLPTTQRLLCLATRPKSTSPTAMSVGARADQGRYREKIKAR